METAMIIQILSQRDLVQMVKEPPLVRIGGKKLIETMLLMGSFYFSL